MLLSAAIIVRDEAEHLDGCLASLQGLVDEIVVVDTGSNDDSVEVARRFGAVVGHEPWNDDFATPRNRSLDLASGEWILYIDADERVRSDDRGAVREQLVLATDCVAMRVRFVPKLGWTPYREYRLWRHSPDIRFVGAIHESMLRAVVRVAEETGLRIVDLDDRLPGGLTIEHLGYEGDQEHKHRRNEPMLRAQIERDPLRIYLYDHLARIYADRGDYARARAAWLAGMETVRKRGGQHPDDAMLWINLLMQALAHDDPYGDVDTVLGEAGVRAPGNPAVEFAVATREFSTGEAAGAAAHFEHLLAMGLDDIVATGSAYDARLFGEWAWNGLGLARLALGDARGAADAFGRAEAADPSNIGYRICRQLAEARAADD